MPALSIILALFLPVLLLGSAAFSSVETALFSLTHADRLRLRRTAPATHAAVTQLLTSPRGLLVSLLLGNTTVNTAYFAIVAVIAAAWKNAVFEAAFGVAALLVIVVGAEVVPKSLAASHRALTCRLLAVPLLWWHRLIAPLRAIAETLVAALTRLFRPAGKQEKVHLTPDELSALLEVGGRQGVLDAGEQRLLDDVVQLGIVRVKDVMTPRVEIKWLEAGGTTRDLLRLAAETGLETFPVCRGDLDEETMVGLASMQSVLPVFSRNGHDVRLPLVPLLKPVTYVPDRARLDQLLDHFRTAKTHTALCVNESGNLTGIVGLDDVIGELVRVSMTSAGAPQEQVRMVALGVWEAPGRLSVRDWVEFFGPGDIDVDTRVSTLAGLVLAKLGRVPHEGDFVTIRNLRVTVARMHGRVIHTVTVSLANAEDSESPAPRTRTPQTSPVGVPHA